MAVDFPSSPTVGQTFTSGGVTWLYDGVKWTSTSAATGLYLPITGGTLTGDLILNRDAQVALGAATLEQVQARGSGANRIINGDMRIDQRNQGAAGTATGVYTVDRWVYGGTVVNKGSWARGGAGGQLTALGFGNFLGFVSSSAYTPLAADSFHFQQRIEADMVSDFCWGTPNAQAVTLSFWASCSLTGTFGGSIRNDTGTRSYPFTFNIPTASTWTQFVITIPGDTAGTWVMSGNGEALRVYFDLGAGANFRGTAGAWTAGDIRGVTGAVNIVGTNGAALNITGVKLELGSTATPFNRKTTQESLADCQRYYQQFGGATNAHLGAGYCASTTVAAISVRASTTMRATPTVTGSSGAGFTVNGVTSTSLSAAVVPCPDGFQLNITTPASLPASSGATALIIAGNWLSVNAEL